ncbi:MAG: GTPase [Actinomycetota bacterium]|nr:GTPase [Actinomycetota bacterium]
MDRQPARYLQDLLVALDANVAEPALQPLERLITRPGSGDALITAIVGPSGVGKSAIVNALAGAAVVTVGPLRPTTTECSIWGDVDAGYLPGTRITGPEPLQHMALVDTPAAEHEPSTVATVLDRVDSVAFVVSPERYADATTATLLATIRDRGIPMSVVLSVGARDPSGFEGVAGDVNEKLGMPIDVTVGEDPNSLRLLLDEMARNRGHIIEQRDRAAAAYCARQVRDVADVLEKRTIESRIVAGKADEAFARARVDRRQLAAIADEEWEVAASAIASMAAEATDRAIEELAAGVARDEVFSRTVAAATSALLPIDQSPIDDWHRATTDIALASINRQRLHPLRSRAVRDDMWRLSVDLDRRPPDRVRKALRDRLPDLRFDRNSAFTVALRDTGSSRIAAFRSDLDPSRRVSAADLRAAADAVSTGGLLTGEVAGDAA